MMQTVNYNTKTMWTYIISDYKGCRCPDERFYHVIREGIKEMGFAYDYSVGICEKNKSKLNEESPVD